MSRKSRKRLKRICEPDEVYSSVKVSAFINKLMIDGKKSVATRIVYSAMDILSKKTGKPALEAFEVCIAKVVPHLEVKSRRVGGSTYQVPIEVSTDRGFSLAMRWLVAHARKRSGVTMIEALSSELLDTFNGVGTSIKKREDTHKMAEANKAFAHFRY